MLNSRPAEHQTLRGQGRLAQHAYPLVFGVLALGLAVFLIGIGQAWRSSTARPAALGRPEVASVDRSPSAIGLEPDFEPLAAQALAESLGNAEPPSTEPPVTEAATTITTATPKPKAKAAVATAGSKRSPFSGLGTWVDVYDWSPSYAKGKPVKLGPSAVDAMADQGVQVLYLQTTRADYLGEGDIVDPDVLKLWLARAEARGLQVVAWYLPTLTDVPADLRRLKATAALLTVDGIGVDIESRAVVDPAVRSRRLVELSRLTREALAGRPLSAITLPNVVTDEINLAFWPGFPWAEIKPFYDVWQPMSYWTNRKADSPYRNAETYTRENIQRMRAKLGDSNAVVHPVGGIGDETTAVDIAGFLKAARETKSVGVSLYDWSTQSAVSYAAMKPGRV